MITLLLVVLAVANAAFVRDGHQEVFRAWMTKHKKTYATTEEYETRFQNFMVFLVAPLSDLLRTPQRELMPKTFDPAN